MSTKRGMVTQDNVRRLDATHTMRIELQTITGKLKHFLSQATYLQFCGGLAPASMELVRRREFLIIIKRIIENRAAMAIQTCWRGGFSRAIASSKLAIFTRVAIVIQCWERRRQAIRRRWRLAWLRFLP